VNLSDSGRYSQYFKKRFSDWFALMKFDAFFYEVLFFLYSGHLISIVTVLVMLITGHISYFLMKRAMKKAVR